MSEAKYIPHSSQTVGPYFRIGLDYLIERTPSIYADEAGVITIRGRVLERDGVPVPDAMLEFWSADAASRNLSAVSEDEAFPDRFRRAATAEDGSFSVVMKRPTAVRFEDGRMQAPHIAVLIFARGLLRHLLSRVYFEDEPANDSDPVLLTIPAERRDTLIAKLDRENSFRWDVILQGADETVFFGW